MDSVLTLECRAAKRIARTAHRYLRCEGENLRWARKRCVVKGITCTGWKKVRHGMETLVLRGRDCVGRDLDFQLPLFSCSVSQGLKEFSDVGSGSGRER